MSDFHIRLARLADIAEDIANLQAEAEPTSEDLESIENLKRERDAIRHELNPISERLTP